MKSPRAGVAIRTFFLDGTTVDGKFLVGPRLLFNEIH